MPLIQDKDAKTVRDRLSKLAEPVTLTVFTQEFECAYCRDTRLMAEEVAALSGGKVSVEVLDFVKDKTKADSLGIDKIPAIALRNGRGEDRRIRFYGIPAGYEFVSLLEALDIVSKGDSGLAPATREKLRTLTAPLALQVFVTPTCPYCPRAVVTAFRFAMESKWITSSMVEATEFPQLAGRYQVNGVPHTVIGESAQPLIGAYPEGPAADMILAALQGKKAP
jgi:glutaredoxin-like protein